MARETCGCRSNDSEWLTMCDAHRAEFQALHARAQREKDMAELLGGYSMIGDELEASEVRM